MTLHKQFLVNDISGAPATSLPLSGFSTVYWNDAVAVTGATIVISEVTSGWYDVSVDIDNIGENNLQLKYNNSNYSVAPDAHTWSKESSHTVDEVYGRIIVATTTSPLPVVPSQRFVTTLITSKEGDDIFETVQVPARFKPLTSWTDITIQAYPAARVTNPSTPAISGTYSATVIDDINGIVDILIGNDVTTSKVPSGASTAVIYADLQGTDGNGYKQTMMTFQITLNRDYNTNT